ncbi:SigE family RNA polymerase sigma factor [Pimelobacter simplex]|uniref:SigE family RNA polymerase sigma factor n=1 Tax=Nocardioides simplex TaxID=2045 RepID=UPI0036730ECB
MPQQSDDDFAEWMGARQAALQRTAYLLAGDHHTAEDLVATTLAKVYLAWDRIDRREAVDAYARRILLNENNSLWRRAWRRREVTSDEVPDWIAHHDDHDEGSAAEVWRLLATLPPRQRSVLVLRYYEQLSEAEIAEALGVATGTVKSQASRALAALRERVPALGLEMNR